MLKVGARLVTSALVTLFKVTSERDVGMFFYFCMPSVTILSEVFLLFLYIVFY